MSSLALWWQQGQKVNGALVVDMTEKDVLLEAVYAAMSQNHRRVAPLLTHTKHMSAPPWETGIKWHWRSWEKSSFVSLMHISNYRGWTQSCLGSLIRGSFCLWKWMSFSTLLDKFFFCFFLNPPEDVNPQRFCGFTFSFLRDSFRTESESMD